MASELAGEMNAKAAAAEPVKRAYVTLLAGADGDSLEPVVQLAESLRNVNAACPLVLAVLPDVPESHREILVSQGCVVREVQPVYPPEFFATTAAPRYLVHHSKLRVWEFVEYERMVYLDVGIKVLENIDALFDLEKGHSYATEIVNTGFMFVHEPNLATAEELPDALRVTPPTSFMKLDFMNMFFRDQYKPIPLEHHPVRASMLLGNPDDVQLDEAKLFRPWGETVPPSGSWFTTKAKVLYRQNLPAMAALAASPAAMGVITSAANPGICFFFYTVFITAIAAVTFSLRLI